MDSWNWFEFNLESIVRYRINANGSAPVSITINHAGYDAYEVATCESQSLYLFFPCFLILQALPEVILSRKTLL
jgi:hypothetical protein